MLDRLFDGEFDQFMTDDSRPLPRKRQQRAAREARLARALRDNLRRRKEQQRAQEPPPRPADGERESPP